jgi:hypothetical protein
MLGQVFHKHSQIMPFEHAPLLTGTSSEIFSCSKEHYVSWTANLGLKHSDPLTPTA